VSCGGGGGDDLAAGDVSMDAPADVAGSDLSGFDIHMDTAGRDVAADVMDGFVADTGEDVAVNDVAVDATNPDVIPTDVVVGDAADVVDDAGGDALDDTLSDVPGEIPGDVPEDIPADTAFTCDPVIYDNSMIQEPSNINCVFSNHRTTMKDAVLVDVWDVSYTSWESIDCQLVPITIRGFASKPVTATSNVPGIVHAHGLGGCSDPDSATGPAALLGYFVLAPTGPGGAPGENAPDCAASEGRPASYDGGYRIFDTIPDPRGSWIWAHSVAAMRGLTCLATRSEVDDYQMGITGYSAGSVATLISAAVDPRVKVAVALSGTGAWGVATQSTNAWQHQLLTLAGLDTSSAQWQALISTILPDVNMAGSSARVMMVNGSSDEFFPLTAHMATYNSIPGADKRTAIIANYDHGCCVLMDKLCGMEDIADIEARVTLGAKGNQKAWFHHCFGTDSDFSYYPTTPEVTTNVIGAATYVMAAVDGGGSNLDVESVRFWASNDGAMNFFSQELNYNDSLHMWDATVPMVIGADVLYYLEVVYKTDALVLPDRFLLSSIPRIPAGFVPIIHPMDDCVP